MEVYTSRLSVTKITLDCVEVQTSKLDKILFDIKPWHMGKFKLLHSPRLYVTIRPWTSFILPDWSRFLYLIKSCPVWKFGSLNFHAVQDVISKLNL